VGSLLRPPELKEAREQFKSGRIPKEKLKEVEDRSIRTAIALQEAAGLQSVTDGEFRRAFWHVDFLTGFDGIVATQGQYALKFHGEGGAESETRSMMVVNGKVRRSRPVALDGFRFLKAKTSRVAKLCIPAPTYLHMRGGRKVVNEKAYPTLRNSGGYRARYREEISDLLGRLEYLQIDDVSSRALRRVSARRWPRRRGPLGCPQVRFS
jgi:5-methyltetrahydropteroyltriglutamate--homocysteine methyltransferase